MLVKGALLALGSILGSSLTDLDGASYSASVSVNFHRQGGHDDEAHLLERFQRVSESLVNTLHW